MKALSFNYVVVLQGANSESVSLVYRGTFNEVLKRAKFACPKNYFIRSISVA